MTSLLALDPGGTTGWSLWEYGPDAPLTLQDFGQVPGGVYAFSQWARTLQRTTWVDQVVAESFLDDGRTDAPDVTPLRLEGAIVALFQVEGAQVVWQRNTAKASASDEFLKRHGLWLEGKPHARDSVRHAIHYAKSRQHLPTIERFWPRPSRQGVVA